MTQLPQILTRSLNDKLNDVEDEFRLFMKDLSFKRDSFHDKLKTFSPLDAVEDFEHRGLQALAEVTRDEMLANDNGFNKLLANMLAECKPGALSDDDLVQITGINGREIGVEI